MLIESNAAGLVYCDSEGGFLRGPNVARQSFTPLIKRAELPRIGFHDLRHTAATGLLLVGENPKVRFSGRLSRGHRGRLSTGS